MIRSRLRPRTAALAAALALALAPAAGAQASRNFLWKVSSDRGALYLVGSVHLLRQDFYPLNPALDKAFADADLLVEEADLGALDAPATQFELLKRGLLPAGQSLETVVAPTTYALVTRRVRQLGLPIEPLERFKPWMLALTLVQLEWQRAGFDASLGLDRHFYDRAKADGMPVEGLETIDFQLSLFDGMSLEDQDRMLVQALEDAESEMANVLGITEAWRTGDASAVEQLLLAGMKDDPVMYRRLLVDRNRAWLPRIDALLARPGRAFVVVGAAHLVGPDGLLAMLRARGHTVEQQ